MYQNRLREPLWHPLIFALEFYFKKSFASLGILLYVFEEISDKFYYYLFELWVYLSYFDNFTWICSKSRNLIKMKKHKTEKLSSHFRRNLNLFWSIVSFISLNYENQALNYKNKKIKSDLFIRFTIKLVPFLFFFHYSNPMMNNNHSTMKLLIISFNLKVLTFFNKISYF